MAIFLLTILYIFFGSICYLAYGEDTNPIITEMLPINIYTSILKVLFCINLVFGYSICIQPTNIILESWLFKNFVVSRKRSYLKNLSRFIVCALAAIIAVNLKDQIDKFLGLLGALLCAPLALTIPTCLHLKIFAITRQ